MEFPEQFESLQAFNQPKEGLSGSHAGRNVCEQLGVDKKEAAVKEEIAKLRKLPQYSTYVMHRLRVLNQITHLLSIQRTTSQDEELELLFAGLSIG